MPALPAQVPLPLASSPTLRALEEFERLQRERADSATRQGRWVDAQLAWDVVLALRPDDADAKSRRNLARASAQASVIERLRLARQTQRRGDPESAARLWLDVLAIAPNNLEAADALRLIERERIRHALARPARPVFAKPIVPPRASEAQEGRTELERATMLAGQGELAEAVALLRPLVKARPNDTSARTLLADLLVRHADRVAARDRAMALGALQESLKLDPSNARAQQRMRDLLPDPIRQVAPLPVSADR